MPIWFITGGVRSGKSRYAERLADETCRPVTYLATAAADGSDPEWQERIARHVAQRSCAWSVIETAHGEPSLAAELARASGDAVLVVDSLGTWLSAQIDARLRASGEPGALDADALDADSQRLAGALARCAGTAIVVSEEVGSGIVPYYPSGRLFRDTLGRLNARLARDAERAHFVVCGYALDLHAGVAVD